MTTRDHTLDGLLGLDGDVIVLDEAESYWAKFVVKQVPPTPEKPHGLDYSLTLHGPNSGNPKDSRLVGFDNAHAVPASNAPGGRRRNVAWDHRHRFKTVRPYEYSDAGTLVEDFWDQVGQVLTERGVRYD